MPSHDQMNAMERGEAARRLMEDPVMTEAFAKIKEVYTREWQGSAFADREDRERAYLMIAAVNRLQNQLTEVINNGKVEASRVRNTVKGK